MLVNMNALFEDAVKQNFAVGGFNFASLESGRAAIQASEELNCPFVLEYAPVHEQYVPLDIAGPIMLQLAKAAKTKVAVHLDHGDSIDICLKALRMGFSSVMYDGSSLPYEENLKNTAFICRVAHAFGSTVEAELGSMPHNFNGELGAYKPEDFYTKPEEAKRFVEETGVDALAISFGTVHGVYKAKPKLDFSVIDRVREATGELPLVMHGGSGLTAEDYAKAIACGIRKINYYTYGALAGGRGVYELVKEKPEGLQFHDVTVCATKAICEDVKRTMKLFRA